LTETVVVDLGERSYEIAIGRFLLGQAGKRLAAAIGLRRLIIVTDDHVARLHLASLQAGLDAAGYRHDTVAIRPGEAAKDLRRFPDLAERLLDLKPDRRTVLVAFGGGVVGDLTGFAAATLLRGLDFVQIPTTLLAQIDSSVGGKTGVDTRHGKNLVGAFHQPRLVLADLDVLATLPARELGAGYAEMVKTAALGDADFFSHLEQSSDGILRLEAELIGPAVARCCAMKAAIVAADERESGRRALLNLGHTFGHALEAETGFGGDLLHGEAIAIGMVLAAELSIRLGRLAAVAARRIAASLDLAGLPVSMSEVPGAPFSAARLIAHMAQDKKAQDSQLTFVVLDAIGQATIAQAVPVAMVEAVLRADGAV
jgi:3-dehydroquinate synthase